MKVKMSLDTQKIKDFFLAHTEKLVFGLFAIGFVWFVYGAITQETYQRGGQPMTPVRLGDMNRDAQNHLTSQVPNVDDLGIDTDVPDPFLAAEDAEKPVKPNENFLVFNPGDWPQNAKRGEPEYLPIKGLKAHAGYGAFQAGDINGKTVGFRWVVLTGLYQAAAQETRYAEMFRNSVYWREKLDSPRLNIFRDRMPFAVQRRDVTNGVPEGDQGWKMLPMLDLLKTEKKWASMSEEVVDESFVLEGLTRELPPLLGGIWEDDESVAYMPEIKLLSDSEEEDEIAKAAAADLANAGSEGDEDDGDLFGGDDVAPEEDPKEKQRANRNKKEGPKPVRLFRFFDFTVEPGRRYQFRVQIAFANPNYGVRERSLARPDLGDKKYRLSQWSDPSDGIVVPRDNDVVAGPVKPGRVAREPFANVILHQWEPETGLIALERFELMRGQLANYATRKVPIDDPTGKNEDLVDISFQTDTILLDLIGGGAMGKSRIERPGEMLLMDADNRLVIRSELDDSSRYRKGDDRLTELKDVESSGSKRGAGRKKDREKEDKSGGTTRGKRRRRGGQDDALGGPAARKKK